MLSRSLHKDSCNEVIELALKIPNVHVVAFGPESCLRVLFFRASRKNLLNRFNMIYSELTDMVTNNHLNVLECELEKIIRRENQNLKAIIIYISCIDILMGTNFRHMINNLEEKYKIPVKIFQRGPLSKRKILPKERLGSIFSDIYEYYKDESDELDYAENAIGILGEERIGYGGEMLQIIEKSGFTKINDISDLRSFEQFLLLGKSKLNIVTHKFILDFAKYLEEIYDIPYIYIPKVKNIEEIETNYDRLCKFLKVENNYNNNWSESFINCSRKKIAVGILEDSLRISTILLELGFDIKIVFAEEVSEEKKKEFINCYGRNGIKIFSYSDLSIDMEFDEDIDVALGEYAINYFSSAKPVLYKPFYDMGYKDIEKLIGEII